MIIFISVASILCVFKVCMQKLSEQTNIIYNPHKFLKFLSTLDLEIQ